MKYKYKNTSHSFTLKANGIARMLAMDIVITPSGDLSKQFKTKGIWDTGATGSVITEEILNALQLKPVGIANVSTASESGLMKPTYIIDVFLKHDVKIYGIEVTMGKIAAEAGYHFLIGMDIINVGDFSITNYQGETWLSFRVPSSHHIDYVQQFNKEKEFIDRHFAAKRNMNSQCICNSGKKFKNCHGKNLIEDKS
jgi:predicted aspartyl protease